MTVLPRAIWRYIEHELYNYDYTKKSIEDLREDIINQVPYREAMPGTSYISDSTGKKAIKLVTSKALVRMNAVITAIDRSLARLNDDHRQLFVLRYKQALSWQQVCRELPTSERSYFRLRRELVLMVAFELGLAESWQD